MDFGSFAFDPAAITGLLSGVLLLGILAGAVSGLIVRSASRG
jgi:hypothetical protein